MTKEVKEKKFEEQIKELEEIINELETGEVDLDLSIEYPSIPLLFQI